MQALLEPLVLVVATMAAVFLWGRSVTGPALFMRVVPSTLILLIVVNWYYLLLQTFRGDLKRRNITRTLLYLLAVNVAVLGALALKFPNHRSVVTAIFVEADGARARAQLTALARKGGSSGAWARWARKVVRRGSKAGAGANEGDARQKAGSALLTMALLSPLFIAAFFGVPIVENLFKNWSERLFLRHQHIFAAIIGDEERVEKAFIAFEGRSLPFKFLLARPTLVVWTNERLILLNETWGVGNPPRLRSIRSHAVRAIRARERFLGLVGLMIKLDLLNGQCLRLWIPSRYLGEKMGEALAHVAQARQALHASFEGAVVSHLCPYCYTQAGKGTRPERTCPSCGRAFRATGLERIASVAGYAAVLGLLVTLAGYALGPHPRAMGLTQGGDIVLLDEKALTVFSAQGRLGKSYRLPGGLRTAGGPSFVYPLASGQTLVGGSSGAWLLTGGAFKRILKPSPATRLLGGALGTGRSAVFIGEENGTWILLEAPTSGTGLVRRVAMSLLPFSRPRAVVGVRSKEVLLAMEAGGVSRYQLNGQRVGWLIHPDDTGLVVGGAVVGHGQARIVDLEPLPFWALGSERPDLVHTITSEGAITRTVALGERILPLFVSAFVTSKRSAVRPSFVCRGKGSDVIIADTMAGRLVRVTSTGAKSDIARGELAQWLTLVRQRRAMTWGGAVAALAFCLLWLLVRLALLVSARRARDTTVAES